jgi:hypothetical protein
MKKTASDSKNRQRQIRTDDALEMRIGRYREKLEKSTGLEVSFSQVVRTLIEKGLTLVEKGGAG